RATGRATSRVCRFLDENAGVLLERLEVLGKTGLPWSLQAILSAGESQEFSEQRARVRALLNDADQGGGPELVGLSIMYPEQLFFSVLIAQELRNVLPGARIVAGGPQITKHIDVLKQDSRAARLFDYLVIDDGEEAFFRLCTAGPHADMAEVPNLYRRAEEGSFLAPQKTFMLHPDDYPVPEFSGFDFENYHEYLPFLASKGCPWSRCAFCSFCRRDRQFFLPSADRCVAALRGIRERYGVKNFFFMDDALPASFMRALAEALTQQDWQGSWSTGIILDRAFEDPGLCALLRRSGLRLVSFGLESVSPRLLGLMNKYHQGLGTEGIARILRRIKEAGILAAVSVFFGFPTETQEEAQATLDFLVANIELFDIVKVQSFCLEDHTSITEDPQRFGVTRIFAADKDVGLRLGYRFETKEGMTQAETDLFTRRALREVRRAHRLKREKPLYVP
ncbi:MAG: B12-binding domain-containing radical SAM protein, partial [Deltaproteobacteria bacterium]